MSKRARGSINGLVVQAAWTFVFLLLAVIACTMAEAQTLPATIVGTSIVKENCSDNSEVNLRAQIAQQAVDAHAAGFKPAISYEKGVDTSVTAAVRVEQRANAQAVRLASSLFAAISNPQAPADGASKSLYGDSRRRANFEMYGLCAAEVGQKSPRKLIDNQAIKYTDSSPCDGAGAPSEVGINASQIYQTNLPPADVTEQFMRIKLESTEKNMVTMCPTTRNVSADRENCRDPKNYQVAGVGLDFPVPNKEYYSQDDTKFCKDFGVATICDPRHMVNRSMMKMTPLNVCGAKVYMVTGYANGNALGMNRNSVIGLIAQINGKTVVIGESSLQAYSEGGWPQAFAQHPQDTLDFFFGQIDEKTHRLTGGYPSLADRIGSKERPLSGVLQPAPELRSNGAPTRNVAAKAAP